MSGSSSPVTSNKSWSGEMLDFLNFWDERFEDYRRSDRYKMIFRDAVAGMVVALVAIPLGIGFSLASGMRPEQGIIAGAVAGILGGIFGGSKYQVYGPTAAFIPVISGIVSKFDVPFMILCSLIAGLIVIGLGMLRLGRLFAFIPHSVIVGFTIGIALTIGVSQLPDILGHLSKASPHFFDKLADVPDLFAQAHAHALFLAILTFFIVKKLVQISVFIPGALIAMVFCTFITNDVWHEHMIPMVSTKYGNIAGHLFAFTPPSLGSFSPTDLIIPIISIVFIAALESLLSARMADRLAGNTTAYKPNKELFGQGLVNCLVPMLNGFPCTGALARTATNIKVGAVSPLSSIFKGSWVIVLMVFFASYLNSVPMAYVGGLLAYVAFNMVKPSEVEVVVKEGKFHIFLMLYTALVTVIQDLFVAVSSATIIYYLVTGVLKLFARPQPASQALQPVIIDASPESSSSISETLPACPNCGYSVSSAAELR